MSDKLQIQLAVIRHQASNLVSAVNELAAAIEHKPRRGRPPRDESAVPLPATKKRRGRPPKKQA